MLHPNQLKNFYKSNVDNIQVYCNVQSGFSFRLSNIMQDYINMKNQLDVEKIELALKQKYNKLTVDSFIKKLELYKKFIFKDSENLMNGTYNASGFTVLTLNIIHECNLRCKYCFEEIDFRQDTLKMTKDIAIIAIDKFIKQLHGKQGYIIFTGGEPLLNYRLIQYLVQYIKNTKVNISYMIKTNGTLLTEEKIKFLIENKFDVQISLDGFRKVNDLNRIYPDGSGTYDKVISVIDQFVAHNYCEQLFLHGTVTHDTVPYISDSFSVISKKYPMLQFDVKLVMDTKNKNRLLSEEEKLYFFKNQIKYQSNNVWKKPDNSSKKNMCGIGLWHITVDVNGDIYPCYRLVGNSDYFMGNIIEGNYTITNNKKLLGIYNMENSNRCKGCYAVNSCTSGCYADKLLLTDNQCEYGEKIALDRVLKEQFNDINNVAILPRI
ncbi:radical SAM protein [Clostridium sp. KNHs205]|jgi:uncharacterized protein|uniref:radical SAM/SPASM domain-containing protein n=1 Tax=Clostridium sp. KNHs205 TaxID=1449050 RepID=UPI00051C7C60|nr:radical SAM protein [Clostridium sp. KNHs205]